MTKYSGENSYIFMTYSQSSLWQSIRERTLIYIMRYSQSSLWQSIRERMLSIPCVTKYKGENSYLFYDMQSIPFATKYKGSMVLLQNRPVIEFFTCCNCCLDSIKWLIFHLYIMERTSYFRWDETNMLSWIFIYANSLKQ